jgi:hypothetical protein
MYDWQKWSTDLDFWDCVDQTLWSGRLTTPPMSPHLPEVDGDERSRFEGFETVVEDRGRSTWSRLMYSMKRLDDAAQDDLNISNCLDETFSLTSLRCPAVSIASINWSSISSSLLN